MSNAACMVPTASALDQAHGELELSSHLFLGLAFPSDQGRTRQSHIVEGDDREAAGQVDRVHGRHREAGRVDGHEHLGEAGPRRDR